MTENVLQGVGKSQRLAPVDRVVFAPPKHGENAWKGKGSVFCLLLRMEWYLHGLNVEARERAL